MLRSSGLLFACLLALPVAASEDETGAGVVQELTPEELKHYEFETDETPATVSDLSTGQRYVLSSQRDEINDLVARHLGILGLKGNVRDLETLQDIVDGKLIKSTEVREWQGLGIVFGDILVNEFDLHWVSYEDDLGISKALRWRKTENYVFPLTLFSKRIQFNEDIEVPAVYEKLAEEIRQFKEYERSRVSFD